MQIVIDIPEERYQWIKEHKGVTDFKTTEILYGKVRKGIPLPKGHGRLIDADPFSDSIRSSCNTGYDTFDCETICDAINEIDAVLEADKSEKEDLHKYRI